MKKIRFFSLLLMLVMGFSSCDFLTAVSIQSAERNGSEESTLVDETEQAAPEVSRWEALDRTEAPSEERGEPIGTSAPVTDRETDTQPLPPVTDPPSTAPAPLVTDAPATEEPKPQSVALSQLVAWLETVADSNVERVRETHEKSGARVGDQNVHYFVTDLSKITSALNSLRQAKATPIGGGVPAGETVRYTVFLKNGESYAFSVVSGVYRGENGVCYTVAGLPSLISGGLRSFSYVTDRPWDVYGYVGNSAPSKLCSLPNMDEMDFMAYVPQITDRLPQSRMSFYLVTDISWLRIYVYSENIFWVEDSYGNKTYYRAMGSWNFYELIEEYGNISVYPLGR